MRRTHVCLSLYFDPDQDPSIKAEVRHSFVRALNDLPLWAVMRGFDQWEKTSRRRPSPGEIRIAAEAQLRPITDELKRRDEDQKRRDAEERQRRDAAPSPEVAAEIMRRAGFTAKRLNDMQLAPMATTFAEAAQRAEAPQHPHWSETAPPDDPRWVALRASRAKNRLCNPEAGN